MKLTRRRAIASGVVAGLAGGVAWLVKPDSERSGVGLDSEAMERFRRANDRITEIVPTTFSDPVAVERVPFPIGDRSSTFERIVDAAQHVYEADVPAVIPGPMGRYDADSRTIEIADLDTIPEGVPDEYLDGLPSAVKETHPDETLFAHELTHALQHDTVDQRSGPQDFSVDGRCANRSIVEGTATYAGSLYASRCRSGSFEPCATGAERWSLSDVPLWALARRSMGYVNGAQFVQHVLEERDWTAIWDLHREAPHTSAAIMFPDRYAGGEPPALDVTDRSSPEWLEMERDRLGVNPLYVKLLALGRTDPASASSVTGDRPVTAVQYGPGGYRADVLRKWSSDEFVGYVHVDDTERFGYVWMTEWNSPAAAERIAETVTAGYEDLGERDGTGWHLRGRYHSLDRDGTSVRFGMGPDRAAVELILGTERT
jgi:hypothetical protein